MRILGVDYGRRRVGIAVSDPLGLTAQGRPTQTVGSLEEAVSVVASAAADLAAEQIVVGHPLNMDGSRGEMAVAAEAFAERVGQAAGLPVCLWDERLTSAQANRALLDRPRSRKQKGAVDRLAAVFLLDSYLRARGGGGTGD